MRRRWLTVLTLWLALAASAFAQIAVPPLTGAVVDLTGTLDAAQKRGLEAQLREFATRRGSQIAVLMVPTTRPEAIEQFSIRVAEAWKIGRAGKDDGVIVLVAKDDRAVRFEVGYGLEGAIPDALAKRVVDSYLVPRFKEGDFYGGLTAGVAVIEKLIEGEKLPPPPAPQATPGGIDPGSLFGAIVLVFVLGGIVTRILGRALGAGILGGVAGVFGWLVYGSLAATVVLALGAFILTLLGAGRSVYYGGGGWRGGGGFGGGFGGGGGFSGGGGGFGGGGASGRW